MRYEIIQNNFSKRYSILYPINRLVEMVVNTRPFNDLFPLTPGANTVKNQDILGGTSISPVKTILGITSNNTVAGQRLLLNTR